MTDDSVDTADALQVQIDAAKAAGNNELAQALYQKQQGTDDPYGREAPDGGDDPSDADTDDGVADSLSAVGSPPDGEWTFDRPEVVDHQFALMEAAFGELATDLKSEWGADSGLNLEFAAAASREFEANYPELTSVLDKRGGTNDPLIIEMLAVMGREWAETPGDPGTVRLFPNTGGHEQETTMSNTNDIQSQIRDMEKAMDRAEVEGDREERSRLFRAQQELYRRLPGGGDPVVGSSGGPTT